MRVSVGVEQYKGVDCSVKEQLKCVILKWLWKMMKINEGEFVERVYESKIEGNGTKGRLPVN